MLRAAQPFTRCDSPTPRKTEPKWPGQGQTNKRPSRSLTQDWRPIRQVATCRRPTPKSCSAQSPPTHIRDTRLCPVIAPHWRHSTITSDSLPGRSQARTARTLMWVRYSDGVELMVLVGFLHRKSGVFTQTHQRLTYNSSW